MIPCPIWGTPAYSLNEGRRGEIGVNSPRAGGKYRISHKAAKFLHKSCDERIKARLTTWLIDQRYDSARPPLITRKKIKAMRNAPPTSGPERANRVLKLLIDKTQEPGTPVKVDRHPKLEDLTESGETYLELLAHAESPDLTDAGLVYLLRNLERDQLIEKLYFPIGTQGSIPPLQLTVAVAGFKYLESLSTAGESSSMVFVAMWFDDSLNTARDSIKRAIRAAGYEPRLVDEKEFPGRIDDEILSDIRKSRFVVADLTHGRCGKVPQGRCGARGSVYYEAGYAHALGLDVIFTCEATFEKDRHFDILPYNTILWKDEEDLRERLERRIVKGI